MRRFEVLNELSDMIAVKEIDELRSLSSSRIGTMPNRIRAIVAIACKI